MKKKLNFFYYKWRTSMWCAITKSDSNGAPLCILMAHYWCAISIWYTNGAPVVRH